MLDLGRVPLANALLTAEQLNEPEDRFPLELYFCPQCALVQIGETVPPERLFRDYAYASSFSDTMVEHARTLVEALIARRGLGPESLVIEVASNDGYLLQFYQQRGIPVLGIEPAANIAELAIKTKGIPTLVEFFDEELAGGSPRKASLPTSSTPTMSSPMFPIPTDSPAASSGCSSPAALPSSRRRMCAISSTSWSSTRSTTSTSAIIP